jgi:hypothetical protein
MATPPPTADWYRRFAELEAAGHSAVYEDWALGVAGDPTVLALIEALPFPKRQPNLILACARLLGAPEAGYAEFRRWLLSNWDEVAAQARVRMTQTNEARRCAALLPALARIGGPIALIELGASAGLCLYPDRYSYDLGGERLDPQTGPSPVMLSCDYAGPIPTVLPDVTWRAGSDLNPLDVGSSEDVRWLTTLIWPEQHERRERLSAAIQLVAADPPLLLRGDAIDTLEELLARVPSGTTPVVQTSGMLVYLPFESRMRLVERIRASGARWVSLEAVGALPAVRERLPEERPGTYVLALDERPLAWVGPHGQFVEWIQGA